MKAQEGWSEASPKTLDKIKYIYHILTSTAESHAEAASIISGVLVHLWLVGRSPDGDIDNMLQGFTNCVKLNVERIDKLRT